MKGKVKTFISGAVVRQELRKRLDGFTLVELLVVISIISLLIAMLMPALNRARSSANRTACRANLHAVGVGFRMYLDDNNDLMPYAANLPSAHLNDLPRIADVLKPFLVKAEVLRCPADQKDNYFQSEGSSYAYNQTLGGQRVEKTFLGERFGETQTHVMYDYDKFHPAWDKAGGTNFLFADGHVGS